MVITTTVLKKMSMATILDATSRFLMFCSSGCGYTSDNWLLSFTVPSTVTCQPFGHCNSDLKPQWLTTKIQSYMRYGGKAKNRNKWDRDYNHLGSVWGFGRKGLLGERNRKNFIWGSDFVENDKRQLMINIFNF
jgi:hypothetical protein